MELIMLVKAVATILTPALPFLLKMTEKGIEKIDVNSKIGISNIINKFIPKIIKFQKEGTTPTWSQINSTEISSTSESSGRGRGRGKRGRGRK